jgi:hypothetical protein
MQARASAHRHARPQLGVLPPHAAQPAAGDALAPPHGQRLRPVAAPRGARWSARLARRGAAVGVAVGLAFGLAVGVTVGGCVGRNRHVRAAQQRRHLRLAHPPNGPHAPTGSPLTIRRRDPRRALAACHMHGPQQRRRALGLALHLLPALAALAALLLRAQALRVQRVRRAHHAGVRGAPRGDLRPARSGRAHTRPRVKTHGHVSRHTPELPRPRRRPLARQAPTQAHGYTPTPTPALPQTTPPALPPRPRPHYPTRNRSPTSRVSSYSCSGRW